MCYPPSSIRGAKSGQSKKTGQSEKAKDTSQALYPSRHQTTAAALKGANAGRKDRKTDEKVRRITEAKSAGTRHKLGPSALK
jgi:hypothetical protein